MPTWWKGLTFTLDVAILCLLCAQWCGKDTAKPVEAEQSAVVPQPLTLDLMSKCNILCDGYAAKFVIEDKDGTKLVQCECFNVEREVEK